MKCSRCCAICAADIAPGQERTAALGKNDAIVTICAACDEEAPRHILGPDRNYDPTGVGVDFQRQVVESTKKLTGVGEWNAIAPAGIARTPGYVLVRVAQDLNGSVRDAREAWRTIAKEPWAREANYLGLFRRYFVWERPDADAMADIRRATNADALHGIETYRRTP